jgi:hypothetical protein
MSGQRGRSEDLEIESTEKGDSWISCLSAALEQEKGWRQSVFGGPPEAHRVLFVKGGRTKTGRKRKGVQENLLSMTATAFYSTREVPVQNLRFFIGQSPDLAACEEVKDVEALLQLAHQIKEQQSEWKTQPFSNLARAQITPEEGPSQKSNLEEKNLDVGSSREHGIARDAKEATLPNAVDEKGRPEYWVGRCVTDLQNIQEFEVRSILLLWVASVADSLRLDSVRERLISDFKNEVFRESAWNETRARHLLDLGKWYASRADDLSIHRIAGILATCPPDILTSLEIHPPTQQGISEAFLPDMVKGHMKSNMPHSAKKLLGTLCKVAQRLGQKFGHWKPSEEYCDLQCEIGNIDQALQHFNWMCSQGYRPSPFGADPLLRICGGLLKRNRWLEGLGLLERCEDSLQEDARKHALWLRGLELCPLEMPPKTLERVIARIQLNIGREREVWERASALAILARIAARLQREDLYRSAVKDSAELLQSCLDGRSSEEKKVQMQQEIKVRIELTRAHLKAGNQAAQNRELGRVLALHRQLIRRREEDHLMATSSLLVECEQLDLAMKLAVQMSSPLVGSDVIPAILAKQQYSKLQSIYEQMIRSTDKLFFFLDLFEAFKDERRLLRNL